MKGFRSIQQAGSADLSDLITGSPSDGQAIVWDDGNSQWQPGDVAVDTGITLIETQSTSTDVAELEFTSIPQTYNALWLIGTIKSDAAGVYSTTPTVQINDYAGVNSYFTKWHGQRGTNTAEANEVAGNYWQVFRGAHGQGTEATPSHFEMFIHDYASALRYHGMTSFTSSRYSTGDLAVSQQSGYVDLGDGNDAAISSLQVNFYDGTNDIASGNVMLYGLG